MLWLQTKKGFCRTAAAYTALALIGAFMLAAFDAPCFEGRAGKSAAQGMLLAAPAYPVECLAVNTAKGRSFLPLPRQSLPRIALPANSFAAGAGLLYAAVRFIMKTAAHNKKSAILLKLRI
ncbi:MAG: hypothetical protein LBG74_01475 [Spirochaetaceae bacterium]|jgi:hypothetical protein|nr:hypothetical protein [Spirochaetaceae bacterium]